MHHSPGSMGDNHPNKGNYMLEQFCCHALNTHSRWPVMLTRQGNLTVGEGIYHL